MSAKFQFRKDLFDSIGASGVTFAITLVSTPLMTRIFPAEAYGVNGIMMTAATLVSSVGMLGLPVALTRERSGPEHVRLINASAQLALILALICGLGVFIALLVPGSLPVAISPAVAVIFPILVLIMSVQRISASQVTARGLFRAGAVARIVNSLVARGMTISVGYLFQPVAAVMLLSDSAGRMSQVFVTAWLGSVVHDWKALKWLPVPKALAQVLRDYRAYALQSNIAASLPLITTLIVQSSIAWRLGVDMNGQFVLAMSILVLPVSLIALASSPVLFNQLSRAADETPQTLPKLALRAFIGYLAAGFICMVPVIFFGPALFAFVLGDQWRIAGSIAAILAIPQVFAFSLTGLLVLFRVTRQLGMWMIFELIGIIIVAGGLFILPSGQDLDTTIRYLLKLMLTYQIIMHAGCFWVAIQFGKQR